MFNRRPRQSAGFAINQGSLIKLAREDQIHCFLRDWLLICEVKREAKNWENEDPKHFEPFPPQDKAKLAPPPFSKGGHFLCHLKYG